VAAELKPEDTLLIYYTAPAPSAATVSSTCRERLGRQLPRGDLPGQRVCALRSAPLRQPPSSAADRRLPQRRILVNNRGIPDGFCAITACGANELTYGDVDGGFFTRLWLKAARRTADADGDGSSPPLNCSATCCRGPRLRAVLSRRRCGRGTCPSLFLWCTCASASS